MRKLFKIKIKSSEHFGRFVGPQFVDGYRTDPALEENPEVPVPGTCVSLYLQEDFAMRFFAPHATQVVLSRLGYKTELVEVVCRT